MTREQILTEAKELYESADKLDSIREAQDAVRTAAKLIYHVALQVQWGTNDKPVS